MIHSTAIIHPGARLAADVEIGPYAVIDEHVELGSGCRVGPHVYLTGHTTIGANNRFHAGCVIGDEPQDMKYKGQPTRTRIGDGNVFREHVTIHRSNKMEEDTIVGSGNLLMAHCHLGHNTIIGNNIVIANGALLAGHVTVGDRAFISGNCLVHQFTRIGTLAIMQGGAGIGMDLPPFCIVHNVNELCGLNVIGLRRAGFTSEQRIELKRLYKKLFRSGQNFRQAVAEAQGEFKSEAAKTMLDFVSTSKRGVVRHGEHSVKEDAE